MYRSALVFFLFIYSTFVFATDYSRCQSFMSTRSGFYLIDSQGNLTVNKKRGDLISFDEGRGSFQQAKFKDKIGSENERYSFEFNVSLSKGSDGQVRFVDEETLTKYHAHKTQTHNYPSGFSGRTVRRALGFSKAGDCYVDRIVEFTNSSRSDPSVVFDRKTCDKLNGFLREKKLNSRDAEACAQNILGLKNILVNAQSSLPKEEKFHIESDIGKFLINQNRGIHVNEMELLGRILSSCDNYEKEFPALPSHHRDNSMQQKAEAQVTPAN